MYRPISPSTRVLTRLALLMLLAGSGMAHVGEVDPALLSGLEARSVGPAGMSGRVAAVEAHPDHPETLYVGTATGGLWKSVNGGLNFEPLFDDQPVASIGAVAIHPASPDTVWVGTGEGNPRNSASVGNGVYRSRDGGRTWEHLGLERSEKIHRIVLHPAEPDTAWVAALGPTWGDGGQRGVYRTRNGGRTWERVLSGNERTGAADLVQDPRNPETLVAALWEHRRWPWFFQSGGPGSGIFLTRDGGESWKRITSEEGLPEGDLGRIGLAIAPSDPRVVYAIVEAERNGIYRSEDGGERWTKVTDEGRFGNRPFYYADLRVDPSNPNKVYSLWSLVSVSIDGGRTWEILIPWSSLHPDHHAFWIHPRNPDHIWDGNDGGLGVSRDGGRTWRFVANLPLAQYYHVAVDEETPYNIYGGMQDNGSWRGPSEVWENGGIRNHHWQEVGFGDGFDTRPDPRDARRGYAMSQRGFLFRWDLTTGERRMIRPAPPDEDTELRFSWNAGLALDPFDPDTLYFGSQFVHRSRDRGESWEVLSPDLTTDNPDWQRQGESGGLTPDVTGAENYTTITTIAPSPLEQGVLWVGTDDGRVHVTRNGGEEWRSLERRARGVPDHTWVPHMAASPHEAGTAWIVFDNHRRSDWTPYVYEIGDFGRRWRRVPTGGVRGYALVIEQDPVDPDLLYLGTEFGLWISLDRGRHWMQWTHGVPTVAVRDLTVQRTESDLVLGTHGRAAYVLDDVGPLRHLTPEILQRPLHLFPVPDAQQYRVRQTGASRFPGHGEYRGTNEPYGALITFASAQENLPHPDEEVQRRRALKEAAARRKGLLAEEERTPSAEFPGREATDGEEQERAPAAEPEEGKEAETTATLRFFDAEGRLVRTLEQEAHQGLNRVTWNLRSDPHRRPPRPGDEGDGGDGPEVPPGTYRLELTLGDERSEGTVRVLSDPRFDIPREERLQRWRLILEAGELRERNTAALLRLRRALEGLDDAAARLEQRRSDRIHTVRLGGEVPPEPEKTPEAELLEELEQVRKGLEDLEETFWDPPGSQGIRRDATTSAAVGRAQWFLGSAWDAPSPTQRAYLELAQHTLDQALARLETAFREELEPLRRSLEAAGLSLITTGYEGEAPQEK